MPYNQEWVIATHLNLISFRSELYYLRSQIDKNLDPRQNQNKTGSA
ncbi:MAG: hypothetical protein ACRD6U_03435 [Nitrososphaeraceae archaeon]